MMVFAGSRSADPKYEGLPPELALNAESRFGPWAACELSWLKARTAARGAVRDAMDGREARIRPFAWEAIKRLRDAIVRVAYLVDDEPKPQAGAPGKCKPRSRRKVT